MFYRVTVPTVALLTLLLSGVGCRTDALGGESNGKKGSREAAVEPIRMSVRVLAEYPHDPSAYTQGLLWHDGRLYEGTGQYEESSLRRVRHEDGAIEQRVELPRDHFGEGIAVVDDRIIQLTWHAGVAHVWNLDDFESLPSRPFSGEGWGLAFDGTHLYMSDGTHVLTRRDPETLEVIESIRVKVGSNPLDNLNELEWVDGRIWANVYQKDRIVAINPHSGQVEIDVDAAGLLGDRARAGADVLNGIAYRPETDTFFITGKDWPSLFEVVFEKEQE